MITVMHSGTVKSVGHIVEAQQTAVLAADRNDSQ